MKSATKKPSARKPSAKKEEVKSGPRRSTRDKKQAVPKSKPDE